MSKTPVISNPGLLAQFFALIAVCTMVNFSYSFTNPFLHLHFSLDKQQLGFLAAATSSGNLIFSLLSGIWTDRAPFHQALIAGTGLIGGAALLFTVAGSYYTLLILAGAIGVGYSIILPLTNKQVAHLFPAGRQAFAIGLKQSGAPLGIAVGAATLPLLAVNLGWQSMYVVMALAVGAVALVVGILNRYDSKSKRVSTAAAGPVPDAAPGLPAPAANYASGRQKKIIATNLLMGMSFSTSQVIALTFLVPFYYEQVGISLIMATTLLGAVQLAGALARPGMGWLVDHLASKKRLVLGALGLCNAAILLLLGALHSNPGWPILFAISILFGAACMGWFGPVFSFMIDELGKDRAGKASGLVSTFNLLGMSVAAPFFGYLCDRFGNYQWPLWLFALLMLAATTVFMSVRDGRRETAV
ncbi:MAG: MFS transporter [Desulfotomaculaceae bacterium]